MVQDCTVHLHAAGCSVVLDVADGRLPVVVHWGAELAGMTAASTRALVDTSLGHVGPNTVDVPWRVSLLPEQHTGWTGRPGLRGSRGGRGWSTKLTVGGLTLDGDPVTGGHVDSGPATLRVEAEDAEAALAVVLELELLPTGLLRTRAEVTNHGPTYGLEDVVLALPVPSQATELLDLAGRWGMERLAQSRAFTTGTHLREGRRGAPAPTPPRCCTPTSPAPTSSGARPGRSTRRGAATTPTTPSGSSPATRCSAAGSCCCPARWSSSRATPTAPPGSTGRTAWGWTPSPAGSTATSAAGTGTPTAPARSR